MRLDCNARSDGCCPLWGFWGFWGKIEACSHYRTIRGAWRTRQLPWRHRYLEELHRRVKPGVTIPSSRAVSFLETFQRVPGGDCERGFLVSTVHRSLPFSLCEIYTVKWWMDPSFIGKVAHQSDQMPPTSTTITIHMVALQLTT